MENTCRTEEALIISGVHKQHYDTFCLVKPKISTPTPLPRNWTPTTTTYCNIQFKRLSRISAFHPSVEHYTPLFENPCYFQFYETLFLRNFVRGPCAPRISPIIGIFMPKFKTGIIKPITVDNRHNY